MAQVEKQPSPSRVVVALGGNAITGPGDDGSVTSDYLNLNRSLGAIVGLVKRGYEVILTHGNGPQVGNQMIRVEMARGLAPDLPLDVVVADLQGGLGYMIERVMRNRLTAEGLGRPLCALLTLVEVDPKDPALEDPSKFVGPFFSEHEVETLRKERGWLMKADGDRGWRRVVPSPMPISVIESDVINRLVDDQVLVIVTGGGGVPVARTPEGGLRGVEAVVDKDLASQVLAGEIGAPQLFILTGVEKVAIRFGTPDQQELDEVTASQMRRYLDEGHFPLGSMGPKVRAACRFVEKGGERALITGIFSLDKALEGRTGTWIVPG
ncbi:MAG: carbamate kinase [Acidobacteriota bacterium]